MAMPYVALGDSYSAGVGAGGGTGTCFRGPRGYPPLLARRLGLDLDYRACLGARVSDVLGVQLDGLDAATELVTLTIGGNDAGFADVLRSAASPAWLSDSDMAIDGAETVIRDRLPRLLTRVYTAVRAAAPHADVVAATYPRLFNGTDCHPLTFFTSEELERLNRVGDRLATVIGDAAGDAGIEVVDVRDGFEGHAVCDPAPMVNGLVLPVWESFHPTASGHAEYARVLAAGRSSTSRAAEEVRVTFGPDTGASAARFWLPRLDSEESLAAADAAGLDREQVRALGFELRRWWSGGIDAPDLGLDEVQGRPPTPGEVEAAEEIRALGG